MNLSPADGNALLAIARNAIASVFDERVTPLQHPGGPLAESRGVFVTLRCADRLRGCIGRVETDAPLYAATAAMARAAAFADPRFAPLAEAELCDVAIEVSVLSPMRKVDSPRDVVVGTHGVLIGAGARRGLLLPQVPVERGWDRETFLAHACAKAGLEAGAWRDRATVILVFSAQIFAE